MEPDIGHRIAAMLRSLDEVILPAIDPEQTRAVDQAKLVITNLKLIASQHDKAYHLALMELRQYTGLLAALKGIAGTALEPAQQEALAQAAMNALSELRVPSTARLNSITQGYRELADAIVNSDSILSDPLLWRRVAAVVSEHGRDETVMRRAWMAASGVEEVPSRLPTIDEVIAPVVVDD